MELPKVYANKINKKIDNTQDLFYGDNRNAVEKEIIDLDKKINDIFRSINHVYKSKVMIVFETHEEEKIIVGKSNGYLLTLDGEKIKISDIKDIKKIY